MWDDHSDVSDSESSFVDSDSSVDEEEISYESSSQGNCSQEGSSIKSSDCEPIEEACSSGFSEKQDEDRLAALEETFEFDINMDSKRRRGVYIYKYSSIRDLPNSTSKWLRNEEMKTHVFRVFKARRLKIDAEKIFWPYCLSGMDCDIWFGADKKHEQFQKFFNDCLLPIDFDPKDWFHDVHRSSEKAESDLALQTRKLMVDVMASRYHAVQNNSITDNHLVAQMDKAFKYWIASLTYLLRRSPSRLNESAYEHLFEAFAQLFGLSCMPGDLEKLEIPYEVWSGEGTVFGVRSEPDLILYRYDEVPSEYVHAVPLAIIEVKGGKKQKKAQRGSRKRVLSGVGKQGFDEARAAQAEKNASPPKCKRVKFEEDCSHQSDSERVSATDPAMLEEGDSSKLTDIAMTLLPETSSADVETQNSLDSQPMALGSEHQTASPQKQGSHDVPTVYEEVPYGKLPPHAEIPSKEEKKIWNKFLPQLLGEVVAAGSLRRDGDKRTSMAIAVSEYSVTFLNFCCEGDHHFDDIPLTRGAGMDIFISEPLCLLKKTHRERICKILLYLTTFKLPF